MQGRPLQVVLPLHCFQGTQRVFGEGECALTLQTHIDGFVIYCTSTYERACSSADPRCQRVGNRRATRSIVSATPLFFRAVVLHYALLVSRSDLVFIYAVIFIESGTAHAPERRNGVCTGRAANRPSLLQEVQYAYRRHVYRSRAFR